MFLCLPAGVSKSLYPLDKRWREQNVEKVQEYYRKKTEKKKAFDALNPEAAREVRKKKAAMAEEVDAKRVKLTSIAASQQGLGPEQGQGQGDTGQLGLGEDIIEKTYLGW